MVTATRTSEQANALDRLHTSREKYASASSLSDLTRRQFEDAVLECERVGIAHGDIAAELHVTRNVVSRAVARARTRSSRT